MNANGRFSNLLLLLLRSRYQLFSVRKTFYSMYICSVIAFFLSLVGSITRSLGRSVILLCIDSHNCHPIPVQSSQVHSTAHMCHHLMCGLLCTSSSMVSITFSNWKHAWFSHGQSAVVVWQSAHTARYELISVTSRRAMICQILANLYSLSYDTMNTRSHALTLACCHAHTHLHTSTHEAMRCAAIIVCSHYDIIHYDCVTNVVYRVCAIFGLQYININK